MTTAQHKAVAAAKAVAALCRKDLIDAPSQIDAALLVAAAAEALASAAAILLTARFESRADAVSEKMAMTAELEALAQAADALDQVVARDAGLILADALRDLKRAFVEDMNEVIGRLPRVEIRTLDRPANAWNLMQSEHGDRPEVLESLWADFIQRNRLRHPAKIPAGTVEVLREADLAGISDG